MKSMTGFGTARSRSATSLQVSVKSVNGRYLDTRFHMGKEFWELEAEMKSRISACLQRGTVEVYINAPKSRHSHKRPQVDHAYAKALLKEARALGLQLGLKDQGLSLRELLQLPGVFDFEEIISLQPLEQKELLETFDRALKKLVLERQREGRALQKILSQQIEGLRRLVAQLKKSRTQLNRETKKKLEARLAKSGSAPLDPARLGQELIYYLDRSDILEEIHRLEAHLQACQKLVRSPDAGVGKKLDFFCQELLREVNTIGSKSSSSGLTQKVVEAKTLVESLREQVQNIE